MNAVRLLITLRVCLKLLIVTIVNLQLSGDALSNEPLKLLHTDPADANATHLYRHDSATGANTSLLAFNPAINVREAVVSPDKQRAVISYDIADNNNLSKTRLVVVDLASKSIQYIGFGYRPSWSPGGQRILICRPRDATDSGVWNIRANGADREIIDAFGRLASWSPDGNIIAYVRSFDEKDAIVLRNIVEDTAQRIDLDRLNADPVKAHNLFWLPDSKELISLATVSGNTFEQVLRINVDEDSVKLIHWPESNGLTIGRVNWSRAGLVLTDAAGQTQRRSVVATQMSGNPTWKSLSGQPSERDNYSITLSTDGSMFFLSRMSR